MEIIGKSGERRTVYLALLSLACIGAVLAVLTWQLVRQQEKAEREHLELTAKAVLQAVHSSFARAHRMMTGDNAGTREFFKELEESGDILFVGIIDTAGEPVRRPSSGTEGTGSALSLSPGTMDQLTRNGRWQGEARYGGQRVFIAARGLNAERFARQGLLRDNRFSDMQRHRDRWSQEIRPPRTDSFGGGASSYEYFLIVAVSTEKHFAVSTTFRRTAVFQAAYIAAAALFVWILAVRFLARRELAGKALYLERFQTGLWDNLPDGLLIVDGSGVIRGANPAATAMLRSEMGGEEQTSAGSLAGKTMADVALPFSGLCEEARREVRRGQALLEIRSLPFRGEKGNMELMVIVHDRTRIHTLEKNLVEAEKNAALGALATGVAHEIRNPLSALRGFAQYFAKKLAGRQPEEEYAQTMVRESDRLNRVITDLLYLSRPRTFAPATEELASVCRELESLLRLELQEHAVTLETRLAEQTVHADPDALKQTLLNLILNAIEAFGPERWEADGAGQGVRRITVTSWRGTEADGAERAAPVADACGRTGTWLRVTDTGPGIPEDTAAKAFEPFFTTKQKGTGLGLALVHAIMDGHGGLAVIDAASGDGANVSLFFPDAVTPEQGNS